MSVRFISILPPRPKPRAAAPSGPRLSVPWQTRGNRISESLRALLSGPRAPKEFRGGRYFRDCWVKSHTPRRSIAFSIFWHAATLILLIQFGSFLLSSPRARMIDNYDLAWSGPINDLPLIAPRAAKKHPSPAGDPAKPLPQLGADAFHPRQTLISAPKRPNHPRQTLIRPDAPQEPPKILPEMPNIVQWAAEPPRPQRNIRSEKQLQQPKASQRADRIDSPEVPNAEKNIADINFASTAAVPERPALTLASGAVVSAPNKSSAAAQSAEPPPVVGAGVGNQHIIALSASPGPPVPAASIPSGNLSANVSISPDGSHAGSPGGAAKGTVGNGGSGGNSTSPGGNAGGANGNGAVVPGISVSGGNPKNSPGISGLSNGGKSNSRSPLHVAPGSVGASPSDKPDAAPAKSPDIPMSARVKPGTPPERVLGDRTIYTLNINNPNLSSVSGSWILKFAELDEDASSRSNTAPVPVRPGTLSGPVPVHKTDPSYPPDQIKAHIEGEVVLFGIIREDGSVDSVQVVRSLDPVLDKNSMEAFAQWKFTPAHRNGNPVAVEAVVHIPFKSIRREY
jgi:TonB family protein